MANTLKIKRGTAATIPQGQLAEPLFTTDTYDLYIGKGSGGNQRIQNYIASGTSSQFLKGDGSLDSNTYEPSITAGTTLQYWRGDKSWQTLNTGVVPESGPIYFTEPRVLATVLTGLNLSGGGTIAATDSILTAFGKVQNQISALVGGVFYKGVWNANTNTPTLTSSTGTKGWYYVVNVAGSTNLDGITDWKVGDWAIFNGTTWDKVDNTDAVSSVNGFTGAVNLGLGDISNVTLSSPTNNQLIKFDGTTSKWVNFTPAYEPTLTKGNLTEATSSVLTITGGTGAVIGSGTTIEVKSASATQNGVITTGTQTIAGAKTFSSSLVSQGSITAANNFIFSAGTGNTGLYYGHTDRVVLANYTAGGIDFETNGGTIYMTLFPSGNLAVKASATDAGYKLDVDGTGRFTGALSGTSATFSSTMSNGSVIGWFDNNNTTTDQSFGLLVDAGTSANDYAFRVRNAAASELFKIAGNGAATFSGALSGTTAAFAQSSASTVSVDSTSSTSYSAFYHSENGVAKAYWEYINSAYATTARRNYLEAYNIVGGFAIYTANAKALDINTSQQATFSSSVTQQYGIFTGTTPAYPTSGQGIIDGNSGNLRLFAYGDINFYTSSTQNVVIKNGGSVGIGSTSPYSLFQVTSGTAMTTIGGDQASNATIEGANVAVGANFTSQLAVLSNSTIAADIGGGIVFGSKYSGNAFAYYAAIKTGKDDATSGNYGGYLQFATRVNGGNVTERMRITSGGNVGIGTDSPTELLEVRSASGAEGGIRITARIDGSNASPKGSYFSFRSGSTPVETARIQSNNAFANESGGNLIFSTGNSSNVLTERLRITNGGATQIKGTLQTYTIGSTTTLGPTYKWGNRVAGTCTVSTSAYLEVEIGGTTYYLAFANPL